MSGTKAGGAKAAKTNKKLHGEDFYARIGRKGGLASTPTGGFGSEKVGKDGLTGRERARLVGSTGGLVSRRTGVKNGEGHTKKRTPKPKYKSLTEPKKVGFLRRFLGGKK